ncbi:MAG: hypothetical protein JXA44_05570 [Methanospirillaceae archaeon]|nr:hypothetical protein [Methanospirillaceae archaeon]
MVVSIFRGGDFRVMQPGFIPVPVIRNVLLPLLLLDLHDIPKAESVPSYKSMTHKSCLSNAYNNRVTVESSTGIILPGIIANL